MANACYRSFGAKLLKADIDFDSVTVKAMAIDTGSYTVDLATHDALNDVTGGAILATSSALTGVTTNAGYLDADDYVIPAITGTVDAIIYFVDSGVSSTSWLIAYIDTGTGVGTTLVGNNLTVNIDASGIVKVV